MLKCEPRLCSHIFSTTCYLCLIFEWNFATYDLPLYVLNTGRPSIDLSLVLSSFATQLGRHQSALEHAQSALILLQEELFSQDKEPQADRVAVLGIAYHNIGKIIKSVKTNLRNLNCMNFALISGWTWRGWWGVFFKARKPPACCTILIKSNEQPG